jgi:hypothetical protein
LAAMGRTVVDYPEYPAGGSVGLLAHDLRDEAIKRSNARLALATAE